MTRSMNRRGTRFKLPLHSGQTGRAVLACGEIGAATLVADERGLDSGVALIMTAAAPLLNAGLEPIRFGMGSRRELIARSHRAKVGESDYVCMCDFAHNAAACGGIMAVPERTAAIYPRIRSYEFRSAW